MEVELQFVSANIFKTMEEPEKIDYIIKHVSKNKIIVVDGGMSPTEESELIKATMENVTEKFPGVEISTLRDTGMKGWREKLIKLLGGRTTGLTVIGPSKLVKKVKREAQRITMLAEGKEK